MILSFDFRETAKEVILTFYKPPEASLPEDSPFHNPKIELKDPKTLCFNSNEIGLYAPVCEPSIKSNDYKIEVTLLKNTPAKWKSIDGSVSVPEVNDSIYKIPEEESPSEKSLMDVFKDIYAKGDENVKKAMNKSLEESSGTVLSTNWDNVKSKKITPDEQ